MLILGILRSVLELLSAIGAGVMAAYKFTGDSP